MGWPLMHNDNHTFPRNVRPEEGLSPRAKIVKQNLCKEA